MEPPDLESPASKLALGYWLTAALHAVVCLLDTGDGFCTLTTWGLLLLLDIAALCASFAFFVFALVMKDVTGAERSLLSTVAALALTSWHLWGIFDGAFTT